MEYQIIGTVTEVIMLMAYLNPKDKFYIHTEQEDVIGTDLTESANNGKCYVLDNIIFENPDKHRDAILCDTESLSIEQVDQLNEYLEKDERAWISHLYCDELKQLIDYEPFLGNRQCNIPEKNLYIDNEKTLLVKENEAIFYTVLDKLLTDNDTKIVILGNYQHFITDNRISVYNVTEDKEIDKRNLDLLMHSAKHVYLITDLTGLQTKYQVDLINETVVDNKVKIAAERADVDNTIISKGFRISSKLWLGQPCISRAEREYFDPTDLYLVMTTNAYRNEAEVLPHNMSLEDYRLQMNDFNNKMIGKNGELMRRLYGSKS